LPRALIVEILGNAKQFYGELDRAAGKTRAFGKVAGVAGLAIAGGLAYGLEKSVKASMEFQTSMQLVHTQAGVTEEGVAKLSKGVLGMAGDVATAPEELAKGIYHLSSQGLHGQQALDALRTSAEGAKIGQADLEDVTNALGAAVASQVKGVKNLDSAMGSMNATVGAGDMRMQDLADAMGTGVLAMAKTAGVGLRDVDAALAVFGDNNIRGAKAGTLVSSALRLMSAPSKAAAKALGDVGINTKTLGDTLRTKGLVPALQTLQAHFKQAGLDATEQGIVLNRAFGGKQATGIRILMGQMDRLKTKEEEVATGGKKFGEAWKATTEEASFKFDAFKASMNSVAIQLGNALLPAVTVAANALAKLGGWLSDHPAAVKVFAIALGALSIALISITSPITLIVAGLIALSAALAYAWTRSERFREITLGAWNAIVSWTRQNWPEIKRVIVQTIQTAWAIIQGVIATFKAGWREFGGTIKTIVRNDFGAIKGVIEGVVSVIKGVVDIVKGIAHGDWAQVWNGIKEVVGGAVHALGAIVKGAIGNVVAILQKAGSLVLDAAKALGMAIVHGIVSGMTSLASSVKDKLIGIGKGALDGAKSFLGIGSPSKKAADEIGKPIGEGIIVGFLTGTAQLPSTVSQRLQDALDKGQRAVQAAQSMFSSAWSQLQSDADNAFQAIANAMQTPAGKQLALLQAKHDAEQLSKALADAQKQLADAMAEKPPAPVEGQTPEEAAAALKAFQAQQAQDITNAKQSVADAQYAIQVAALQKQADEEQKQLDAQNALRQRHFDQQLGQLQTALENGHLTQKQAHKKIMALFKKFGIDYSDAGAALGSAFVTGLKESILAAAKAGGKIHKTLVNIVAEINLPHLAAGGVVRKPTLALIGERGPEAVVPLTRQGQAGVASSSLELHVHFDGPVFGDKRDVARELAGSLRDELVRIGMREPTIFTRPGVVA